MKCANCGAPLRVHPQSGHFACEYCRSSQAPPPSPDGVRWLGPASEGWRCPLCSESLHRIGIDDRYQGHQCPNCQGLLLARPRFGEAVHSRRRYAGGPPDPLRTPDRDELHRRVRCPSCGKHMDTHPYQDGVLVVDTCSACNLIWLDRGELARAVNAPGRDRGVGHTPPPKLVGGKKKSSGGKKKKKRRKSTIWKTGEFLIDLIDDIFD